MDATLRDAIPGDNPSGENLRYSPIYGVIRARVRRARGEVPDPDDSTFVGSDVEWRFVIGACRDLLRRRSKDLMLTAWLTEAQLAVDGLPGLRDGLDILRGLLEAFWETLYPEIEDEDFGARVSILEWLDALLAAGVDALFAADPKTDDPSGRRRRDLELDLDVDAPRALEDICDAKFGDDSPRFAKLRDALLGHTVGEDILAVFIDKVENFPVSESELPRIQIEKEKQQEELVSEVRLLIDSGNFDLALARAKAPAKELPESKELAELLDLAHKSLEEAKRLDAAPAMAAPIADQVSQKVEFTLTAPEAVKTGLPFEVFVWAHESWERSKVLARAREELNVREILARSKGPFPVAAGTVLSVRLAIPGAVIDEAEDAMVWEGESTCVSFVVTLSEASQETKWAGSALIYANGIRIARISFVLSAAGVAEVSGARYRKAFASYASDDRDAVLGRIQGIRKVAPEMEIFLDVVSLRSGQNWEQELWRVIPASDIFYLFWSSHARKSEWVEKEWRCALRERGLEFIDPIPLEPPQESPPPVELSSLHFNDWELAFMRGKPSVDRR